MAWPTGPADEEDARHFERVLAIVRGTLGRVEILTPGDATDGARTAMGSPGPTGQETGPRDQGRALRGGL
jgi:hypothetical protein